MCTIFFNDSLFINFTNVTVLTLSSSIPALSQSHFLRKLYCEVAILYYSLKSSFILLSAARRAALAPNPSVLPYFLLTVLFSAAHQAEVVARRLQIINIKEYCLRFDVNFSPKSK